MKDEYFVKCDSCGKEYVYESSPMIRDELWESISSFPGSVILVTHEYDFYEGLVDIKLEFI